MTLSDTQDRLSRPTAEKANGEVTRRTMLERAALGGAGFVTLAGSTTGGETKGPYR